MQVLKPIKSGDRVQCERCKDWAAMGISRYCPSCDADYSQNQWGQPVKPFIAELEEIIARTDIGNRRA